MAQKTNLNINPYFDDFSEKNIGAKDKNYYKVLFNPGRSIQARELNTLQSILQDQVETFGSHIFKEGSVVIPGNIAFDNQIYAVKLNPEQFGVNIFTYLNAFKGKIVTGQVSGVTASIQLIQFPNLSLGVEYPTLYVKYINSDANFEFNPFQDNEPLVASELVSAIPAGTPFATTISEESSALASAFSIGDGVYFIRGTFVRVKQETIILDYYSNFPSYRVGLQVDEQIVSPKDDGSLYDNAKGFTNYAAPGADRFKISLSLTKKSLDDFNDTNFVELMRIKNGAILKTDVKTQYSIIKDYLAQRTYDESGNYTINPFQISAHNSLNDRLGNDGLFFDNETTDQKNTPSDDLMCLKLSPGKAYVRGYDIDKSTLSIIDLPKPRTTQPVLGANVPFEMGNLLVVNNVSGNPKQREVVYLQNQRKGDRIVSTGTTIGSARIYNFNLTDAAYTSGSTNWDLYLYDVQTYIELTLNGSVSATELPQSSYIKGKSSGASGYAVYAGAGSTITINQISGTFYPGEQITVNGIETPPRVISKIKDYGAEDIKSIYQPVSVTGFSTSFVCDTLLKTRARPGTITIAAESGSKSTATIAAPASFSGIKTDSIIAYQRAGLDSIVYNRVVSVSPTLTSMTLVSVPTVTGVCDGTLPSTQFSGQYSIGFSEIARSDRAFLYSRLPNANVASVDLSTSNLSFSAQTNSGFNPTPATTVTVNISSFNLGINSTTARFAAFDEERYSIFYTDGTVENLTADKVSFPSQSEIRFSNISNKQISAINGSFVKNGIQSKVKQYQRSKVLNVPYSRIAQSGTGINTSVGDGLTYSQYYGTRVQDEEICLNYPDVSNIISVYESLDTDDAVFDRFLFDATFNVSNNAIIGENIVGSSSNAVARVISSPVSDTLNIVYLNNNRFRPGETVRFEESNIVTEIAGIRPGKYRNITTKFILDKGQREQYYDYSRLVRKSGESSPSRKLTIVFDYYTVPSSDNGDIFTVNSYTAERYLTDIPTLGRNQTRATDVLDFRPRVSSFNPQLALASPFSFLQRSFSNEPKVIISPNENFLLDYQFYVGRIDRVYLDKFGSFTVAQGVPSVNPTPSSIPEDVMELASIILPPYLYSNRDVAITMLDNRRYTMRDIGKVEDRVENLERVTSLSLLEVNVQNLQVQDAQGINRFKSGFFVDDFTNNNFVDINLSTVQVTDGEMRPLIARNSLSLRPAPSENISDETLDLTDNFALLDSNVQKSGEVITLKYESVGWIEQTFATKVENVNPFHVISYTGNIKLTPESDSWLRTIRLEDVFRTVWQRIAAGRRRRRNIPTVVVERVDRVLSTGREIFMRSRNTAFEADSLKAFTRHYQFLDGNSGVDFIPKLLEIANDSSLQNYGSSVPFVVGESVVGSINGSNIIRFRVARSNHKEGVFSSPSVVYTLNPYVSSETIPSTYSSSSKILNVDIQSLCREAQGLYAGYLEVGAKLVGQTSGAVAYVKDLRLITDASGYVAGSFWLRDPLTTPPPAVRIGAGSKLYKLTSSPTNDVPLPGSKLISSGETTYRSEGTWEIRQRTITTFRRTFYDPLAQSFSIGGTADIVNGNTPNEDANGAYLTAVDLYFASKDPGNAPVTIEVRTVELSTPTRTIIGNPVTLTPDKIEISRDASVATKVVFDYPIYLQAGLQYAIVLLAPQSVNYEVWIAEMGEKTIETASLPDSQAIRYTRQFAIGRLYKSQNGAEWTANDYQDMKFKLYKANFTSRSGSAILTNPSLNESNGYIRRLDSNPITILPKEVNLGITTIFDSSIIGILTTGRRVTSNSQSYKYGYIVGSGSSVTSVGITTGGSNYTTTSNVGTYAITGKGSGLKVNITASGGLITGVTASSVYPGTGYQLGDVIGIVTSDVSPVGGRNALISITGIGTGINTLYLSRVQGKTFGGQLNYFDDLGNLQSVSGINVLSSTEVGGVYSGNYLRVNHFNHGMNDNNKLVLSNVRTDSTPSLLTNTLLATSATISVASTAVFYTFEGKVIDNSTNFGYLKIGNEIIKYGQVGVGFLGSLTRGIDSTKVEDHAIDTLVYKYELGGVSLRRINKTHTISSTDINTNSYYVEFDRSQLDANMVNRSSDNSPSGFPELSFNSESVCGAENVRASENILFSTVIPHASLLVPSAQTSISAQIRTVSGTSVGGNEISFRDQGYENVNLEEINRLNSVRLVASKVNEQEYLNSLPRNKSFTLKLDLTTENPNLSPIIFWNESSVEYFTNLINNPISDYASDGRVNSLLNDPHTAIYVSNPVELSSPSTALKVIISAYRHSSADFRVLYSLNRPNTTTNEESFVLFPGYNNLTTDNNQDGYLDVIDPSKNSGLPDVFVPASSENQFLEYEYTAGNLGSFVGYSIKIVMSGTDQAYPPVFRDLRTIALA